MAKSIVIWMKESISKFRKAGYSTFGQYSGLAAILLMVGASIFNISLKVHSIILTVYGWGVIVGSIILFIYSIKNR